MLAELLKKENLHTVNEIIYKKKSIYSKTFLTQNKDIFKTPINKIIEEIKLLRSSIKELYIIVPQYISSICIDDCKYCGFRKSNKLMLRKSLSNEEFVKELNILLDFGYRVIELVYSTDPNATADEIARRIELAHNTATKKGINIRIGLNANVFSYKEYQIIKNAGLYFVVIWMETYNKKNYQKWHSKGTPKYNFEYRLEAYERAIEAGITNYGLGILFGLSDWKEDVSFLINHAYYLESRYKVSPFIFGIPRIKNTQILDSQKVKNKISDADYLFAINLYRLLFPNTKLFFNTREDTLFNINNIKVGGDIFTIDCATFPGAFLNPDDFNMGHQQFKTFNYHRYITKNELKSLGYHLKYDW